EERPGQPRVLQGRLHGLPLGPQHRVRRGGDGHARRHLRCLRSFAAADLVVVVSPTSTTRAACTLGGVPSRSGSPARSTGGTLAQPWTRSGRPRATLLARLLADAAHHRRRIVPTDPAGELAGVLVTQR